MVKAKFSREVAVSIDILKFREMVLFIMLSYVILFMLVELYQMLKIVTRCVQAVIVRPLSAVSSLVRFAEEPQMFAIEFNDGCPIHVSIF